MNCCICEKPANHKVKGLTICPVCIKFCQGVRDQVNSSRLNPLSKINTQGEDPITLREVILRAIQEKEKGTNENP